MESEQASDLVARLERLRPRPQASAPSRRLRLLRGGWLAAYTLFSVGPPLVWFALYWQIHFFTRTHSLAMLLAIPACFATVGTLLWVRKKLGMQLDAWSRRIYSRRLQLYFVWLVGFAVCWIGVWLLLVAVAVQRGPGATTHVYRVTQVEVCDTGRRCGGCRLRAFVQGSPRLEGRVCLEEVRPAPQVGDALAITGHFLPQGIYIDTIRDARP